MKKFKKIIACIGLLVIGLGAVGCSSDTEKDPAQVEGNAEAGKDEAKKEEIPADTVIAKVGDAEIVYKQFADEMGYAEALLAMQYGENFKENEEAKALYDQQKQMVIDYLVEHEVLLQYAKENDITASDEDLKEQMDMIITNFGSEEAFTQALEQQGMTREAFEDQIKNNIIVSAVVEELTKEVSVDDEAARKYYDEHKSDFTKSAGARMAHILVATEDEAKKVKEEYEAGKSFEELAKTYGTDGTKDIGGDLGFIPYNSTQYDADFLAGAKGLKEGEVSDPVKTQFGYHLIKVTEVQSEDQVTPFEEAQADAKAAALDEARYNVFTEKLDELKEDTKIEVYEDQF